MWAASTNKRGGFIDGTGRCKVGLRFTVVAVATFFLFLGKGGYVGDYGVFFHSRPLLFLLRLPER